MFTKKFGSPPLANDYSYANRTTTMIMPLASRVKAETINSRPCSPRDVTHILELHCAWWERRMRDNGKEDAVGCEITRKRTLGKGGGADKRGGGAFTIPILSMWKNRGGGG